MRIYINDEKSILLQHIPSRNNCTCGNQIVLEVGDVVGLMPFAEKRADGTRPRDHLSFFEPRMFQIVCPVCYRGITWENPNPNTANTGGVKSV